MLRYSRSGTLSSLVLSSVLALVQGQAAYADGVAVFASLTDESLTRQTQGKLEAGLNVAVEVSRLDINGTPWVRLHSAVLPETSARALVERAQLVGYSAWYNGSGDSLVSSSSAAAAAMSRPTGALIDQGAADYGVVTPATGDVSHLPFAETLPLDETVAESDSEPN